MKALFFFLLTSVSVAAFSQHYILKPVKTAKLTLDLGPNLVIQYGDTLTLGTRIHDIFNEGSYSFKWYYDEKIKSGLYHQLTPRRSTQFILEIMAPGGCILSDTLDVEVAPPSFVKKNSLSSEFGMYPNPSFGKLNLFVKKPVGKVQVEVYDFSGQLILKDFFVSKVAGQKRSLGVLDKGIYLVKLKSSNSTVTLKQIVN